MLIEQVKKLTTFNKLLYWIRERENIRLKKEAGEPKPWTDDNILQSYRFCNIRRMDDKVSRWLYDNWYTTYLDQTNILVAAALARFINKSETLDHVGFPIRWSPEQYKNKLRDWRDDGNTVFNGAYMVRGNDGMDKIECVVDYYVSPLAQIKKYIDTASMEASHVAICKSYGMGSFMAGQVVADLRWGMSGTWSDRCDWAPIGPGSRRGMNRLKERDLNYQLGQTQFLAELREFIQDGEDNLPESISSRLEAIDWQNCLCEYDKYNRVLYGEGRPKQKYSGAN